MKATIKHEVSRVSTWGIAILAALAEFGPQIKDALPPHAALIVGISTVILKNVLQGKPTR